MEERKWPTYRASGESARRRSRTLLWYVTLYVYVWAGRLWDDPDRSEHPVVVFPLLCLYMQAFFLFRCKRWTCSTESSRAKRRRRARVCICNSIAGPESMIRYFLLAVWDIGLCYSKKKNDFCYFGQCVGMFFNLHIEWCMSASKNTIFRSIKSE